MIAEMSELKQAIQRDTGHSRQALEQIYTAKFQDQRGSNSEDKGTKEEFFRDLPASHANEQSKNSLLQQLQRVDSCSLEMFRNANSFGDFDQKTSPTVAKNYSAGVTSEGQDDIDCSGTGS